MRLSLLALTALTALTALIPAAAQTSPPIQIRIRQNGNFFAIPNGSTINMAANAVGKPVSANITVTYQGNTSAVFATQPGLIGSSAFAVSSIGQVPLTVPQNGSFTFDITYIPTSTGIAAAQIAMVFTEPGLTPGSPSTAGTILLNLTGTTPDISLAYALSANANLTPITTGGTIPFGEVTVNGAANASFVIVNRGSGPGPVTSASVTGEAFQIISLPLLPVSLGGGGNVQFGIRYTPKKIGQDTGVLTVQLGPDTATINLQGSGTGSTYSYEILPEQGDRIALQPSQVFTAPDTDVNKRIAYTVQVRNNGNAAGAVNLIGVSGTGGFSVTDLPFLPFTLNPGDLLSFTLVFQPVQPGRQTGRLRIGNDVFDLVGNGIGSRLTFSYNNGSIATPVQSPGTVLFSPLAVGQSAIAQFEIKNEGTAAASINSIGVSETRGVFKIESLPRLPASLEAGGTLTFNLVYTPAVTGLATAQMLIDTQLLTLSGFATAPPPLPGYLFSGANGNVEPFTQPGVRLALLDPYPIALQGVLNLTIESESFAADPAIQFSSGGRSVPFTIPANSTEAIFPNGAREIRLQTGTVAGVITLTPLFATVSGLDLTPESQSRPTLKLTVPRLAPSLVSLQIGNRSTDSVTLVLTGFSTTRSVTRAEVQFTPKGEAKIAETRFTIDLDAISTNWFRTPASDAFGGQFSLALPFTLRASAATAEPILNSLESVSVTVSNSTGASNRVSVNLQ